MSEFEEKLNPDKLASTAKIERKAEQVFFKQKKYIVKKWFEFDQVDPSFGELEVIENIDPLQFYCHSLPNHYTSQCNLKCDHCDFS